MGLYPYLDFAKVKNGNDEFWVNNQGDSNNYINLRKWLN